MRVGDTDIKRWAETWESAGKALEALRRRELRAMTDDDTRRAIADIFSSAMPADVPPRTTSGLVEQQRLFESLRRRA
jgi:hypothetical protein